MEPGSRFLKATEHVPSEEDLKRFQSDGDDKILTIERVRTADGEPVVYCIDRLPASFLPTDFVEKRSFTVLCT